MKLIDQEKVDNSAWELSKDCSDKYENNGYLISSIVGVESGISFIKGVDLAETELQNLAIEFAEWIGTYYDYSATDELWYGSNDRLNNTELFTKFITERNK